MIPVAKIGGGLTEILTLVTPGYPVASEATAYTSVIIVFVIVPRNQIALGATALTEIASIVAETVEITTAARAAAPINWVSNPTEPNPDALIAIAIVLAVKSAGCAVAIAGVEIETVTISNSFPTVVAILTEPTGATDASTSFPSHAIAVTDEIPRVILSNETPMDAAILVALAAGLGPAVEMTGVLVALTVDAGTISTSTSFPGNPPADTEVVPRMTPPPIEGVPMPTKPVAAIATTLRVASLAVDAANAVARVAVEAMILWVETEPMYATAVAAATTTPVTPRTPTTAT